MPLRIAIDGVQSTGKTTLQRGLASCLGSRFTYIPEASRVVAHKFSVNSSSDWQRLLSDQHLLEKFFDAELLWQKEQESVVGDYIVDSSLLLVASYRLFFGITHSLETYVRSGYDLILYCPLSEEFVEDGFRFSIGRSKIDEVYRHVVGQYHAGSFITLPHGQGRLTRALTEIQSLL